MLRLRGVAKTFSPGKPVLRGLSAEIPLQGVTYVVGRSGSGKSVLCRLAVGLLRPDAGEVELLDERVDQMPERSLRRLRAQVPYLVQGPALLSWRTVLQNVALACDGDTVRATKALEQLGLDELSSQLPTQLGPGAQKRVAIARALALRPRFMLLDEPTTGLDRGAAKQVNQTIAQLRREGLGALVVSHDYASLEQVADNVLMVSAGEVAFFGSAREFLTSGDPQVRALTART
ncbi:MAG: ABC transporter ATP-binding protein [Myxococcaceae bacterium]